MLRAASLLLLLAAPAFAQLPPDKALASMKAGDGLQVELFAAEPMLINPTSLDVDPLGRVWIAEAVNYRTKLHKKPLNRKEGDRIQVLVDETGEGKATKAVTFYQGEELFGPLSVCVIPAGKGYRVLVAQSPDILEFACKDAANPVADGPPKKFLTGFGGFDHDHGVHGLHLGPDGKLYFTVGDQGVKGLQSADGKGRKWDSNKTDCQAGTVWRCDLDGKNLELIAHNFRNNYEACVDSFGEIWLSDNDDDGNQQTRICHVMPGGNYGYFPRGQGQSHWHEEQPGIVHKTLRTGFGSPTGIQFYEGSLLPKQYHNTLLHCDAGPREVRAFTRKPKGAGYELDKAIILTSSDNWFRPSDVCTAPDGSVFVCDWYDPGVGGHGMGDTTRGRVYRLTPAGHKGYKVPEVKLNNLEYKLATMMSPCLTTRMIGQNSLKDSKEELSKFFKTGFFQSGADVIQKGRLASFLPNLVELEAYGSLYKSIRKEPDALRMLSVRLFSQNWESLTINEKEKLSQDFGRAGDRLFQYGDMRISVAREFLLLFRQFSNADYTAPSFYSLAKLYDGQDIFYRAALNIACGTDPARRDAILADFDKQFPEWNDKVADLVWELRPKVMLPKLAAMLADPKFDAKYKPRLVDILAASESPDAGKAMLGLLNTDQPPAVKARAIENLKLFLPTKWNGLAKGDELKAAVAALVADAKTVPTGLQLVAAANYAPAVDDVAKVAGSATFPKDVRLQAVRTLGQVKVLKSVEALTALGTPENEFSIPCVQALGEHLPSGPHKTPGTDEALEALKKAMRSGSASTDLKTAAIAALAGNKQGTDFLLGLQEKKELAADLVPIAGRILRNCAFQGSRNKAMILFPPPGKLDPAKLPPYAELAKRMGNVENGKAILARSAMAETQCAKCHSVNGSGGKIGPDLGAIGKKASKENLYESLIQPSKAIADQYLSWKVDTDDGQSIVGLLIAESETTLTIRDANGKDYSFPVKGVEKKKQATSLMPEGLINTLTEEELVDLVEYLFTLRSDQPDVKK